MPKIEQIIRYPDYKREDWPTRIDGSTIFPSDFGGAEIFLPNDLFPKNQRPIYEKEIEDGVPISLYHWLSIERNLDTIFQQGHIEELPEWALGQVQIKNLVKAHEHYPQTYKLLHMREKAYPHDEYPAIKSPALFQMTVNQPALTQFIWPTHDDYYYDAVRNIEEYFGDHDYNLKIMPGVIINQAQDILKAKAGAEFINTQFDLIKETLKRAGFELPHDFDIQPRSVEFVGFTSRTTKDAFGLGKWSEVFNKPKAYVTSANVILQIRGSGK